MSFTKLQSTFWIYYSIWQVLFFFITIMGWVGFFESMFLKHFHSIYYCRAFDIGKNVRQMLVFWSVAVFILLDNIFNYTFNYWWEIVLCFLILYKILFWKRRLICMGLVCWVLWHLNLCRLFDAKSIFM